MFTENVNVYRFSGVGPLDGFAPAGATFAGAGGAGALPNMIERLMPRFTEKKPGPMPRLRGINACPAAGFKSKSPNFVLRRSAGSVCAVANAGRSVNNPSPFVSRPVTILKGRPLE